MTVERQKRHLLDELGLSSRPPYIYRRLKTPSVFAGLRDENEEENQGGVLHKLTIESAEKSWTHHSTDGVVSDHFHYYLNSIDDEIVSAFLVLNSKLANISVTIFEVDEVSGETKYIDRVVIAEVVENESVDFGNSIRNWVKSRQMNRILKLEIKDLLTSSLLDSRVALNTLPHFEVTVFQSYTHRNSNCNNGCCVIPFYVNFTEIGWNDWILYPQGFWANYCSGSCSRKTDENYELMKLTSEKFMIPEPSCAPNYYGSIDIVIALSPVDIRRTRAHGMRVFSCSCL